MGPIASLRKVFIAVAFAVLLLPSTIAVTAPALALEAASPWSVVETTLRSRAAIEITSDADFTALNGVRSGRGTAPEPYVISDWRIVRGEWSEIPFLDSSTGILLRGTTLHVIVEANDVRGFPSGIVVENARNVRIVANVADASGASSLVGIRVTNSEDVSVERNTVVSSVTASRFDGIVVAGGERVTLLENVIRGGRGAATTGVLVVDAARTLVQGNRFSHVFHIEGLSVTGFRLKNTSFGELVANVANVSTTSAGSNGLIVEESFAAIVRGNEARGASLVALHSRANEQSLWEGNVATGSSHGLLLEGSRGEHLAGNVIAGNKLGFGVRGTDRTHYYHSITPSNSVNGRPVVYHLGLRDVVLDGGGAHVGWLGIVDARNVTVRNFNVSNAGFQGALFATFHESTVANLVSWGNTRGVDVHFSNACRITNSSVNALRISASTGCLVEASRFSQDSAHQPFGVRVDQGSVQIRIERSIFTNSVTALDLASGPGNVVAESRFEGNQMGLFSRVGGNRVSSTAFTGNGVGAYADTGVLDARNNWWGHASGPSGRHGGAGDAVNWRVGVVDVDPWLTSPS